MAELHVIAAGSLLEFALEKISMPVGRIEPVQVRPFTFFEFLQAIGRESLVDIIREATISTPLSESMHLTAIQLFREYSFYGGMPAVLNKVIESSDINSIIEEQQSIVSTYRNDFHKYATRANTERIESVFSAMPSIAGKKVAYSKIDPDSRAFQIRNAIDLLEKAYVVSKVKSTSGAALPLAAGSSSSRYKMIMVDSGMLLRIAGLNHLEWGSRNTIVSNFLGAVIEQVIGQELICLDDKVLGTGLYYWDRAEVRATAEVDFLFANNGVILPIEVKAGSSGHLKSMYRFLADYQGSPFGIRISERSLSKQDKIINVPLYATACISDLIESSLRR